MDHALMCPQCNAPLTPHRFAASIVCSYCGTTVQLDESLVSAATFHKAFRTWNSPQTYKIQAWFSLGENHWAINKHIAHGDIADVYTGQRARWPTELAIIKLLRDRGDITLFDNEWAVLQSLQRSEAPGADTFTTLLPQPILHGDITAGAYSGQRVSVFRWISGFQHTFEDVLQAYPQGIPPRASIWIWRRILEILSFIHNSGMVHGAVLPSNLLVQENEHGVRLVGYSAAGQIGEKLRATLPRYESFYPRSVRTGSSLSAQMDIVMSARCIVLLLGGNPDDGSLPTTIPTQLSQLIQRVALSDSSASMKKDAWALREELGAIADNVFGAPQFIPIVMPS